MKKGRVSNHYSIKRVVIGTMLVILLVSIAMSLAYLWTFRTQTLAANEQIYYNSLSGTARGLRREYAYMSAYCKSLCGNEAIKGFVGSAFSQEATDAIAAAEKAKKEYSNIKEIVLIDNDGRFFNCFGVKGVAGVIAESIGQFNPHGVLRLADNYYTVVETLYDVAYENQIGYVAVVVDCDSFLGSFSQNRIYGAKYIVTYEDFSVMPVLSIGYPSALPEGLLADVLSEQELDFHKFDWQGENWHIAHKKTDDAALAVFVMVSDNTLVPKWPTNLILYTVIWSAAITAVSVLIYGLFRAIRHSANEVDNLLRHIDAEDFAAETQELPISEFNHVVESIEYMTDTIRTLNDKNLLAEKQLLERELAGKQATLSALKNQINPHFIYNTLSCVKSLGMNCGDERISEICSSIIKILRYSIKENQTALISEEIEALESYLYIQSCRYPQRFTYKLAVDESILQQKIMRFLLQPIIENSIVHGLISMEKNGKILISGKIENENIVLCVSDTGKGMPEETLKKIIKKINSDSAGREDTKDDGHGIALANINRRLKLFYGEEYGLKIESVINMGTFVTVTLPQIDT